jgi:hypothetical protein
MSDTSDQEAWRRANLELSEEITIKIPNLTAKECGDLAITAAEGGISYWSQIEEYRWSRWDDGDLSKGPDNSHAADDPDFVFYTIRENDGTGTWAGPALDITPTVLRRGYKLYREQGYKVEDPEGPSFADANEADLIVQLGLFGREVYA